MTESTTLAASVHRNGLLSRLSAWFSQERVFRWIPFVMVEGMFILILIIPFALTIYISFLRWRANRPFEQAYLSGLRNYESVIADSGFWDSLGRTFYFAGAAVVFELIIGFFLALMVHQITRGRRFYITILLIPMMVVPVVAGYNFSMIYLDSGPLNQILAPGLNLFDINPRIRWLSNPIAAQWAIILADIWQWTSLTFLIFLSGFSALPPQLINAARVMGASRRQTFFWVELPLLKPAIVIAVVIRSMEALKMFDPVVLLTFGGPGTSTQTVAYYLWEQVWQFNKYSFGAAASIMLLIIFSVLIFFGIYLIGRQGKAIERGEA
ncbi:MAG: sugar ABC transporter permease [Rhodospirillales bacterium]|jgi:multiple sugar transport system permease protein|nr:sugar ABC transporter permease [Rhodospirillales bacterium]|tara:strand:+ start:1847 stop:2818 length:972 start_codon:yes stop_codon:yes gene_type:complete